MSKPPDVDFCQTLAREVCMLCGFGYAQSAPMFTRDYDAWICPQCVRDCFLRLAEEGLPSHDKEAA